MFLGVNCCGGGPLVYTNIIFINNTLSKNAPKEKPSHQKRVSIEGGVPPRSVPP